MINPFRRDIITISRKIEIASKGAGPEFDLVETIIFSDVRADIQYNSGAAKPRANLPGDVDIGTTGKVFFSLPRGSIKNGDIFINEEGQRYQITYNYWTVFQYNCIFKLEQM